MSMNLAKSESPIKAVWPFVLLAVLSIPVWFALWYRNLTGYLVGQGIYYTTGDLGIFDFLREHEMFIQVGVTTFLSLTMLAVGVVGAVQRTNRNNAIRATTRVASPVGHTTDGQPIYPVVGYTPDGKPVTADQAVGVRPMASGTNGTAIAALILAFIFPIVGAILGFIARGQIKRTGQGGDGLALAGIIIGGLWTIGFVLYVAIDIG